MTRQYPHLLFVIMSATTDSVRDESGNWIERSTWNEVISVCREKSNGKGEEVISGDGKHHIYSSLIFLPVSCPEIAEGTIIYVKDSETATKKRIEGPVLKFDKGQMHSRLWV